MPKKNAYIVTYVTADGERKTETLYGRSHKDVEREVKRSGGNVTALQRDESYAPRTRSKKRVIGCMVFVVAVVILGLILYWQRVVCR